MYTLIHHSSLFNLYDLYQRFLTFPSCISFLDVVVVVVVDILRFSYSFHSTFFLRLYIVYVAEKKTNFIAISFEAWLDYNNNYNNDDNNNKIEDSQFIDFSLVCDDRFIVHLLEIIKNPVNKLPPSLSLYTGGIVRVVVIHISKYYINWCLLEGIDNNNNNNNHR